MSFSIQLRAIMQESANRHQGVKAMLTALVISLLAGYVIRYDMFGVYENAKVGFFIIVCCCLWSGMFDSILTVCGKRDVLERDKASGMRAVSYIAAAIVFQAIHALGQSSIMFCVMRLLIDFPDDVAPLVAPEPVELMLTLFLVTFASQMMGLAISCVMTRNESALTFAPFMLIYQLIMSETLFGLPDALKPLRDTTVVRWGLNALGTIYDIDALPWKAEDATDALISSMADGYARKVQSALGFGDGVVRELAGRIKVPPEMIAVNHDLPEYAATPESLRSLLAGLAALAGAACLVSLVGFLRRARVK